VAVKTVKEGASSQEKEDLLRELEIMQQLGSHPNVVTLLGCCTEKGNKTERAFCAFSTSKIHVAAVKGHRSMRAPWYLLSAEVLL
jgi:serine/threonine protein kinase